MPRFSGSLFRLDTSSDFHSLPRLKSSQVERIIPKPTFSNLKTKEDQTDLHEDVRRWDNCRNDDFDGYVFRKRERHDVRHEQVLRQRHLNRTQVHLGIPVTRKLLAHGLKHGLENGEKGWVFLEAIFGCTLWKFSYGLVGNVEWLWTSCLYSTESKYLDILLSSGDADDLVIFGEWLFSQRQSSVRLHHQLLQIPSTFADKSADKGWWREDGMWIMKTKGGPLGGGTGGRVLLQIDS